MPLSHYTALEPQGIAALKAAYLEFQFRPFEAFFSGGFPYKPAKRVMRGPQQPAGAPRTWSVAMGVIQEQALDQPTPENLHTLGVAHVFNGNFDQGIDALRRAVQVNGSNESYVNDLAVAYFARATSRDDANDYAAACEELLKLTVVRGSRDPGVLFNTAIALQRLENRIAAEKAWNAYLAVDRQSPRAEEARRHLARLRREPARVSSGCADPLRERHYAENEVLPQWANAVLANDTAAAGTALRALDEVGGVLRKCSDDGSLLSMSTALRAITGRPQLRRAAASILALRSAIDLSRREQGRAVAIAYEHAADELRSSGLPIHQLAVSLGAFQYYYVGDRAAAKRMLDAERRDEAGFPAWTAQRDWVDGLLRLTGGSPFESLELYRSSLRLFERTHESRYIAAMNMLIAENLTALGATADAWLYRLNALSALAHSGDTQRLRVALNEAAEAALVSERPFVALAYQQSAEAVEKGETDSDPLVTLYGTLWLALLEHRCGLSVPAFAGIRKSRELANEINDEGLRGRAVADLDFAEGLLWEMTDPGRAAALWSEAIDHASAADMHYRAAQLFLARARVFRRLGETARAEQDLLDGVGEVERQRKLVADEELRTSYFGQASDLYDALIALLMERGDVAAAYGVAERRRERTLLDAVEGSISAEPMTADRIRKMLGGDEAVLDYAVLPDRVVRWEIRRDGLTGSTYSCSRAQLRQWIDSVYAGRPGERDSRLQKRALASLGGALIPLTSDSLLPRRLVFIPDPSLTDVPFNALIGASGRFLVETHTVEVQPSASVFAISREREREAARRAGALRTLVFGDTRGDEEKSLPALDGARRELRDAAVTFGTNAVLDNDATGAAFLRAAPAADVIYVAGHAVTDVVPARSALVVAGTLLPVEQIRQCRLRGRLVVLGACSTAANRGEGVTSLVRAFMVAGAAAVTASLLPADDAPTARLLTRFARELKSGAPPAEALRRAQLKAIADRHFDDPLSWAAFQIYGSGSLPVINRSREGEV